MTTVTLSRELDASADVVRETIRSDLAGFIRASGFDSVTEDGDSYVVARDIGMATFELTLAVRDSETVLYMEQTEGMFDEMWTDYQVEPTEDGSRITATTEFTLGGVLGPILDATMITVQRKREFELQFDYLAAQVADSG